MSTTTGIEWTDATWNPIRGCSRVSEGCRHCYAEAVAHRFSGAGQPYEGLAHKVNGHAAWTGEVRFVEKHLLDPLKWGPVEVVKLTPRRIFVNSMSDLFHENVKDEWIDKIFAVMALCPQHTFQVLTKRPERMLAYTTDRNLSQRIPEAVKRIMGYDNPKRPAINPSDLPLPNVWLGVSCENRETKHRVDTLRAVPAAVRFLSLEPLLEDLGDLNLDGIHWVIAGGESGPGARPMHPDWARGLRDQCQAAGVPFFFKQWGEWGPGRPIVTVGRRPPELEDVSKEVIQRLGKKAAGAVLDGREWREFPA